MPEYGTTTPAAGWYPDPAGGTLERWWGGVEWTETTRPIQIVQAAPEPAFAGVPGGGINPFAGEVQAGTSRLATYDPASAFSTAPTRSFSPSAPSAQQQVAESWNDAGRGETPRNGAATRALVFSIIAWIFNPLFIFTILAFVSAKRALENARMFEYQRHEPVGRSRARVARALAGTGLALYLIGFGLGVWAATGGGGFLGDMIRPLYAALLPGRQNPIDGAVDNTSNPGVWAFYERSTFEGAIRDGFVNEGVTPDSVTCPDMIVATKGTSFSCQIVVSGGPVEAQWTFTDDEGGYEQYINGVLVE